MTTKNFLRRTAFALLATAAFATTVSANGIYQGYISQLTANINGSYSVGVQFTGAIPLGSPACASGSVVTYNGRSTAYMTIKDAASNMGKLQIELLRDALTTQKLVTVYGNNTCTVGLEDISSVVRYSF
ncbi:MAG: hypothetical protein ABIZ64_08130 [Casimicrobium sp.]